MKQNSLYRMTGSSVNGRINTLPQLVLTDIFQHLKPKDKFACASVCKKWEELILTNKSLTLWKVLTLHLKPEKGPYGKKEHEFHIQMCEKYLTRSHTLVLYVCNCQVKHFTRLSQVLENSSFSKQRCVIFRRESFNKCCQAENAGPICWFTDHERNMILNLRHLQQLSFGFDCHVNGLTELCSVLSTENYSLTKLNVASVSCCMYESNLDLSWMCELHDVTVNFETLTENTLQGWIRNKSCHLKKLKIVFLDTTVDDYFNKQNVISNTDLTNTENFPSSQTWSMLKSTFPSLKIQLIFVAASTQLKYLLSSLPCRIPFQDIVIIFKLNNCPQSLPFRQWFHQQGCSEVKSVKLHGMEHDFFHSFSSVYSDNWFDFFCNEVESIEHFTISGMFVAISKLKEYVATPTLRNICISRQDLVVESQVLVDLQVKPSLTQVANYEKFVSAKLNRKFRCDVEIPIQVKYKDFSLLNISRGLLQKEEDIQM